MLLPIRLWKMTLAKLGFQVVGRGRERKLRFEQLEPLTMLTGITVAADAPSYSEGQTVWFSFGLSEPAPEAFYLDLLLSGGPAGPTGYVMPIAQGQTSAHVDFPTTSNSTPGDGYTMLLEITGSSESGPSGPFGAASTEILDDDGGSSGGGGGGPTGPASITLDQPDDAYEGTPFELTGTISPPGYYTLNYSIDWNYGGFQLDPQTGEFSVWLLIPDDGPSPGNDTPSDVMTIEMIVWGNDPQAAVSDETTVTVHNVDPTFLDPYTQEYTIDIYDYPPGGPNFNVLGTFHDDGWPDQHVVTIDWGDDSEPTVFVPFNYLISASHHYEPDGGSYTITVTVEDDDTGVGTYSETISMYLLDLDNDADNNGAINEDDDPIEDIEPGAFITINTDDDNLNETSDMLDDGPVANEDDLEPMLIRWSPANRPYEPVNNYIGWHIVLTLDPPPSWDPYEEEYNSVARLYTSPDKSGYVPFEDTYAGPAIDWVVGTDAIPSTLYVEARALGVFRFQLELRSPGWELLDWDRVVFKGIEKRRTILLFGYWPRTDIGTEARPGMLKDWESLVENYKDSGFNVLAISPKFKEPVDPNGDGPGIPSWGSGSGDLMVDYYDTSEDFWRIVKKYDPVAIMAFGRTVADTRWELEEKARNLAKADWIVDYNGHRPHAGGSAEDFSPFKGDGVIAGNPPDRTKAAGETRSGNLPTVAIDAAIDAAFTDDKVNPQIDASGNVGSFLCEYMAYHVAWYREWVNADAPDDKKCLYSGFTHVGSMVTKDDAKAAVIIQLDELIKKLKE
ncbi:MAG: PKD domain-containing protein [Planctomycetaceae bacterium]|nr:PKD domain-containing protein [Planctomycetaceae bacterium]